MQVAQKSKVASHDPLSDEEGSWQGLPRGPNSFCVCLPSHLISLPVTKLWVKTAAKGAPPAARVIGEEASAATAPGERRVGQASRLDYHLLAPAGVS